jgi:protein phosphatase 1 regulatory subunit 7
MSWCPVPFHLIPLLADTPIQASSNRLDSFKDVETELSHLANLETVYLEHNPLQVSAMTTYRRKVKLLLPQIKQIDAQAVRL